LKTRVINKREKTRAPFLRGILIRTLLEADMSFDRAYELASVVRDQLADLEKITSSELRTLVSDLLLQNGEEAIQKRYLKPAISPNRILVVASTGTESVFSRGNHQRYLQSSGVRVEDAERITTQIFDQLQHAGTKLIGADALSFLTYHCLLQELGKTVARQYLVWKEFQCSARPLILLISGSVGSGKSSIATEIAHQLEIDRTQSTDMLREVMRTMISKKLLPILHCSSFDAWKSVPGQDVRKLDKDKLIAKGYMSQCDLLSVPSEAVMSRAVKESVSLILEGVHSHPQLMKSLQDKSDTIVVHVTLAVMSRDELKARLRGRGADVPQRRSKRYLNKLDSIWRLQSFLLGEADRLDTPIIPNDEKEVAIFQIISTVNAELSKHFSGKPEGMFDELSAKSPKPLKGLAWRAMAGLLVDSSQVAGQSKVGS
jgi:2-phosphoglycerate kinase